VISDAFNNKSVHFVGVIVVWFSTCTEGQQLKYLCPEQSTEIYTEEKKLMLLQVFNKENLPEAKCTLNPWALIRNVGTVKGQTAAL
jgi:hypothetical protein